MRAFVSDGGATGGGSGDGPFDDERHKKLQGLVAGLKELNSPDADVNKPGSDDLRIALHEEDSRSVVLWAVLRPFLKVYASVFPEGETPLPEDDIAASIDEMLDQGRFFLTQALIKRHLRAEGPLSLAELAGLRYSRDTPSAFAKWERYQRILAREIFDHARDTQVWRVVTLGRVDRNGGGAIAGYEISAGQALIDFDNYVYQPKRAEQVLSFQAKFGGALKEKTHA